MKQTYQAPEGKCLFCSRTFIKAAINRHLQSHLNQKAREKKKGQSYPVKAKIDSRRRDKRSLVFFAPGGTSDTERDGVFVKKANTAPQS